MSATHASPPQRLPLRVMAFNLARLAVIAACFGLALAYAIDDAHRARMAPRPADDAALKVDKTVAGQSLTPPLAWLRDPSLQSQGFAERLDLIVPITFVSDGARAKFDLTLLSVTRARISAYLLDTVYLERFAPEQLSGPVGLVGKPLRPGDGYDGDTIWYDPLSADPFVARCSPPVTPDAPARCVRTIALDGALAAIVSFDADLLDRWRELDAAIAPPLSIIGTGLRG